MSCLALSSVCKQSDSLRQRLSNVALVDYPDHSLFVRCMARLGMLGIPPHRSLHASLLLAILVQDRNRAFDHVTKGSRDSYRESRLPEFRTTSSSMRCKVTILCSLLIARYKSDLSPFIYVQECNYHGDCITLHLPGTDGELIQKRLLLFVY